VKIGRIIHEVAIPLHSYVVYVIIGVDHDEIGTTQPSLDSLIGDGEDKPFVDVVPSYVAEVSKSGRAECRKCDNKISKNELRIGVITEGDWGK